MSKELNFGEYLELVHTGEIKDQFVYNQIPSLVRDEDVKSGRSACINSEASMLDFKKAVREDAPMFSGRYFLGAASVFFENEGDFNIFKIKHPDLVSV